MFGQWWNLLLRGISLVAVGLVFASLFVFTPGRSAEAVTGSQWDPGNIISDADFFNRTAMNEAQVQAFLQSKVPNCVGANGYPCLKNYSVSTFSRPPAAGAGHCDSYAGAPNEPAARIIVKVAQACGINPQVLLVTLQKERSLITDTSPTSGDYQISMGYACPDTAPCDSQYYGFYNQVYWAAWQFRQYTNFPDRRYKIGDVSIQFNPDASCGSTVVRIRNQATANLYNYTPYQPNAAALANLYGSGDRCSAYGNRNFWVYFNDWFPSSLPPNVPFGNLEVATTTISTATFRGWAIDPDTTAPLQVHLYVNGNWGGAFVADRSRGDVGAAYPTYGSAHGFEITVPIGTGTFEACLYAINVGAGYNSQLGCRTLSTPTGPPIGNLEYVSRTDRTAHLGGWALDPDTPNPVLIHVYANGAWAGEFTADTRREDVGRAYAGYGDDHGFAAQIPIPVGTTEICVFAINQGGGANSQLGCGSVSTASGPPIGNFEWLGGEVGGVRLSGWALDPDTANSIAIHVYANGAWAGAYTADKTRADIDRVYPGYGTAHGFIEGIKLSGGNNSVCVYGINVAVGYNQLIGCRTVNVPAGPPIGNFEWISPVPGGAVVNGWAIDPDTASPISIHLYANGRWAGAYTAGVARPDVERAYPGYGPAHGFQQQIALPSGSSEVCAYGINVGQGYNQSLGCRTVIVSG